MDRLLRILTVPALLVLTLLAAGCGAAHAGAPLSLPAPDRLPASASSHVVVVVMENHEAPSILGNRQAPFINHLTRSGALATRSYAVSHPSLPNYLALVGGSTFGITSDCTGCSVRATNVIDQLEAAHVSWKAYLEDMPRPCYAGSSAAGYAKKHNPFIYFRDLAGNRGRCQKLVPYRSLAGDLRSGALPSFVWISPNLCDDMHDCSVARGDRFLAGVVPGLLRELGPHGFLVLTWDEGESSAACCRAGGGGRVATIVVGPDVRRGGRSSAPVDHYSVLRTLEDAFGVGHLAQAACACTRPLDALFSRPPRGLTAGGR